MLKFARNKLVSIYREDQDTLVAYGILEDDIYGLEIDLTLRLPDLEILSIGGNWKRVENCGMPKGYSFSAGSPGTSDG